MRRLNVLLVVVLALGGFVPSPPAVAAQPASRVVPTTSPTADDDREIKRNYIIRTGRRRVGGKPPGYTPPPESPLERCRRLARERGLPEARCRDIPGAGAIRSNYEALARTLIVYLRLPDTPPQFGPDPDNNEWNMLAVGYPIWLWVDGPRTRTAVTRAAGLEFRLTARRTATVFTLGDGTTLTCPTWTRYTTSVTPGDPSPTCGHTYTKTSPTGGYTVTATAHWTINWSVDGHRGTIPVSYSDTSQITIGELQALVR